jgi:hypothetical protein
MWEVTFWAIKIGVTLVFSSEQPLMSLLRLSKLVLSIPEGAVEC